MYVNARAIIEQVTADGPQIVVQLRDKPGQPAQLELPGGQVEPYESLIDALIREVLEETGLRVTRIVGSDNRVVTADDVGQVECVQPFAAYQTLAGPVDSMGVYFLCQAAGSLMRQPGESRQVEWRTLDDLSSILRSDPERFSWVDRAGLTSYLEFRNEH